MTPPNADTPRPALQAFDPQALEAVIVDLDGTLVDTLGDFDVALNLTLGELGLPSVDRAFISRTVGKGSEHLIRTTLAAALDTSSPRSADTAGEPTRTVDRLFDRAFDLYQRHYLAVNGQHADVYAGAAAGLQVMKARGLKLACLTNKPTSFAVPLLEAKGLDGFFEVVFGGDAFERKKPDPLPLRKTCEALGTEPGRTLMLGDSSNDAQAARAAGCPVALVSYGYNHGEPIRQVPADLYLDRIDEIGMLWE
jgi:phosphoglycolate phosphatase